MVPIFTQTKLSIAAIKRSLLSTLDDKSTPKDLVSLKCDSVEGFKDLLFTQSLAEPMDVRCLDGLVRVHVLLAVMSKRTSPEHQLNLLRASTFVLQIWQARPPCITRSSAVYASVTLIECGEVRLGSMFVPSRFPWQHILTLRLKKVRTPLRNPEAKKRTM